jgi:hypothetical protein
MGAAPSTLLGRFITDALALLVGYGINFIGCDLMYHDWNLQQSLRGAYWFFLGPILYVWGTAIPWVMAWIKTIFFKVEHKIHSIFSAWWDDHDPFKVFGFSSTSFMTEFVAKPFFSTENISMMRSNVDYLKENGKWE